MSHKIFIKLPASKTRKKVNCTCKVCKGEKEPCDPRTRDAHIERYGVCEELVGSTEPQVDFPSPTDPHIEGSGTSETDILFPTLIDISLQEESFLVVKKDRKKTKVIIREQSDIDLALETLNASDSEEEITEVEPESDDEDTILDYSAPDIENGDEKIFEDIENLDQDFGQILIWILRYQQRYRLADTATESLIKFMHFLLTDLDQNQFKNFPPLLYLA